jgi:hypothetical protein
VASNVEGAAVARFQPEVKLFLAQNPHLTRIVM